MAAGAPEAIIYDLDGTLVHSSPDIAYHLNAALRRHVKVPNGNDADTDSGHNEDGAEVPVQDIEMMIGGGLNDLIRQGIEAAGGVMTSALFDQVLASYRDDYLARPVVHTTLYDGVVEMLDRFAERGVGLGLCTNKTEYAGRAVLDHYGLTAQFGAIIGGDSTPERKPAATPLNEVLRQLGARPDRAIMVGDSIADYGAARNAGTKVILVDWGYSARDIRTMGADAVIASYAEFDDAVAKVMAGVKAGVKDG